MKKILITLALLLAVVTTLPLVANAEATDIEKDIANYVADLEKVTKAVAVVYERNCVVAIQTEKFVNKSEYDTFKEQVEKDICDKFNVDLVKITRSPRAMHAIVEFQKLSQSEREEAIRKFIEHETENKHLRPTPYGFH